MSFRKSLALLLLLAAPLALAHGEGPATTFNPLDVDWTVHATTAGTLSPDPPETGRVFFGKGDPVAPPPALAFGVASPVRFAPGRGIEVILVVTAEQALVARDAQGDAFEVGLAADGQPVEGASRRVALESPVMAPGGSETLRVVLQAPAARFEKGQTLSLRIQPLMPALPENALRLDVGPDATRATFESMRIPTLDDLNLQDSPLRMFLLENETFAPADPAATVVSLVVTHDGVDFDPLRNAPNRTDYLVLRGEEPADVAHEHHEHAEEAKRRAAAHGILVGKTLVRVVPGIGVVVPVPDNARPVPCETLCPTGEGFSIVLDLVPLEGGTVIETNPYGSVLVPPPRSTAGVPVSEDAPEDEKKGVPHPAWAAPAALGVAALRRRGDEPIPSRSRRAEIQR